MKKQNPPAQPSISGSVLKPLIDKHKQAVQREVAPPPKIAKCDGDCEADYQDSGNGYNRNLVFPQK
jgi:hypothetical protein